MHFFPRKKNPEADRIGPVSKKEAQLLKRATEIPKAGLKQKSLELEAISKTTLPLLAEDEKRELKEAVKNYLEVYSQVGGVYSLDLSDLEKRLKMNREFQFRKQLLKSSFLKDDFSDDLGLFENDFYELFSDYILTGQVNTELVSFEFNKKAVNKLKSRWDKLFKFEEHAALKRTKAATKEADRLFLDQFRDYLGKNDSPLDLDFVLSIQLSPLLLDQFKTNLIHLLDNKDSFDQIRILFIHQANDFLIDPTKALDYLESYYLSLKEAALKEEIRLYLFYDYQKNRDQLLKHQQTIDLYLKRGQARELKAGRLLKRQDEK
jgi:hypothetical protein